FQFRSVWLMRLWRKAGLVRAIGLLHLQNYDHKIPVFCGPTAYCSRKPHSSQRNASTAYRVEPSFRLPNHVLSGTPSIHSAGWLRLPRDLSRRKPTSDSYLLYSSTMSCSFTGVAISSRFGSDSTRPFRLSRSTSSQATTGWWLENSRAPSTAVNFLALSRTWISSPWLTANDGMFTRRPFTSM